MDPVDPGKSEQSGPITRRYFLELIGVGSILVTAAGTAALSGQYLSPNVLLEPPLKFRAGKVEDFPEGSVTLIEDQKTYVVRAKEGSLYAMSAVCTHLGCITAWDPTAGIIRCPCHGSQYDRGGNVLTGPAPRPLPHYALTLNDQKQLVVDTGTVVGEDVILRV